MVISQQKMELFNENIIPTRTLREIVSLDNVVANQSIVNGSFNGGTITIGSKENVFKVDRNGIYLGASSFSVAPFRVDMQGNLVASSATIAGDIVSDNYIVGVSGYKLEYETGNAYLGNAIISGSSIIGDNNVLARTIGSSINQSGQFIKDVVNTNLSTATKQILGDFTFGSYGALQIGTYESGVSGDIRISPNGILGRNKDGDTTFSINGTTGDATFGGTLVAASGTFGTVTAGILSGVEISGSTITGGTIQTSSTGQRVEIKTSGEYENSIAIFDSSGMFGLHLYDDVISSIGNDTDLIFGNESLTIEFPVPSSSKARLVIQKIGGTYPTSIDVYSSTHTLRITGESYGNWNPTSNNSYNLGSSSYRWANVHTNSITLNGVTRTSWPASFSGNLSDLYINTTKSWGSYGITGLGTITPYSNNSYDLGSSSYYWRNVYGINIIPSGSYTSYLGNSNYHWDYFYVGAIRGASGIDSIEIENNAFTRYLFPAYNVTYDIGSSGLFYSNVFTQSLRLRTGQSTNPANDGEIRYYDVEGGGYRGRVRGYLMQFDGTLK